jgi:hypothetical protein
MKTVLETGSTWFLESISKVDRLCLVLAEGIVGKEEDTTVCGVDFRSKPVNVEKRSRRVRITFDAPVAWQLVDESFSAFDDSEVRDDTSYLQILSKSKYLEYVNANHGWYSDVKEAEGQHFRIWTEDDVIDVVSCDPPTIEEMNA